MKATTSDGYALTPHYLELGADAGACSQRGKAGWRMKMTSDQPLQPQLDQQEGGS